MQHSSPTLRTTRLDMGNIRGVTLIELLVAIVILGLIVTSVYTAFNSSRDAWQVGEIMVQRYQNARAALDMMSREISAMYVISGTYRTGLLYHSASNYEFRFVAAIPGNSGSWDLCKVGYRYAESDEDGDGTIEINEQRIQRGFDINPDLTLSDFAISNWEPLVSNITSLEFICRYHDGSNWDEKDEWDSRSSGTDAFDLPEAVEIAIGVQDDKQLTDARTFRTIVYIPGNKR